MCFKLMNISFFECFCFRKDININLQCKLGCLFIAHSRLHHMIVERHLLPLRMSEIFCRIRKPIEPHLVGEKLYFSSNYAKLSRINTNLSLINAQLSRIKAQLLRITAI